MFICLGSNRTISRKFDTINTSFQEAVWCITSLKEADSLLVGVIYRSPRSSESNDASLLELLKQAQGLGATHTYTLTFHMLIEPIGLHQNRIQQEILSLRLK